MLDGEAIAAPAPKSAAPVASTEKASDTTDRFVSMRPLAADELLSTCVVMFMTVVPKDKGTLSELDELAGEF